jgi:hypothetical protein
VVKELTDTVEEVGFHDSVHEVIPVMADLVDDPGAFKNNPLFGLLLFLSIHFSYARWGTTCKHRYILYCKNPKRSRDFEESTLFGFFFQCTLLLCKGSSLKTHCTFCTGGPKKIDGVAKAKRMKPWLLPGHVDSCISSIAYIGSHDRSSMWTVASLALPTLGVMIDSAMWTVASSSIAYIGSHDRFRHCWDYDCAAAWLACDFPSVA